MPNGEDEDEAWELAGDQVGSLLQEAFGDGGITIITIITIIITISITIIIETDY